MTTAAPATFCRIEHVMGTAVSVEIAGGPRRDTLRRLTDDTFAWLHEVDRKFSTYRAGSEITRLHNKEIHIGQCSPDVQMVLDTCAELWRDTGGWFDVYATGILDPSGYVKGWAAQVASDRLTAAGAPDHCINAGGDVRTRGHRTPGQPWRVGIRHPWQPHHTAWILHTTDLAIATSGIYERGPHVINPYTGQPAQTLQSVTITGPDLGIADAYATAAVAMGEHARDWLATLDGYECAIVFADGTAYTSEKLPGDPEARRLTT